MASETEKVQSPVEGEAKPQTAEGPGPVKAPPLGAPPAVKPASFLELEKNTGSLTVSSGNMNLLLDVPLKVAVNLGSTKMLIKDLLRLGQGSVVELDKIAGDPMDILIGEKLIARGEIVVVNEMFGVRITDIISPAERIETLK